MRVGRRIGAVLAFPLYIFASVALADGAISPPSRDIDLTYRDLAQQN